VGRGSVVGRCAVRRPVRPGGRAPLVRRVPVRPSRRAARVVGGAAVPGLAARLCVSVRCVTPAAHGAERMFDAGDFGAALFSEIVAKARAAGYVFARFDRAPADGKVFFLRHDVDISARNTLVLGRLAQEQGIQSNFFFQLNAETYSIFSDEVIDIMRTLRAAGHCVGLHVDEVRFGDDEGKIRRTIDWFSSCVLPVDDVVSFHRPSPAVLGKRYTSFLNAYDARFFGPDFYLSDSR